MDGIPLVAIVKCLMPVCITPKIIWKQAFVWKAKKILCRFCAEYEIPFYQCGKLFVAIDEQERMMQDKTTWIAQTNGMDDRSLMDCVQIKKKNLHFLTWWVLLNREPMLSEWLYVNPTIYYYRRNRSYSIRLSTDSWLSRVRWTGYGSGWDTPKDSVRRGLSIVFLYTRRKRYRIFWLYQP